MSKKFNEVMKSRRADVVSGVVEKKPGKFYLGLDDVQVFFGKRNKMKPVDSSPINGRVFANKFLADSKRAAELVFLNQMYSRRQTCDPKVINDFWKNVKWDKKNNTLIYDEYLTIGTMQTPKSCQMEEFNKGKYEFYLIRHEIQVLETNLVEMANCVIAG